jgi:hypothetical protein
VPAASAAGQVLPGLVIDVDASIVVCHSEKEQARRDVQAHLRLPPAAGLPGQLGGVPSRAAAAG